ncbi:zinc finger, CCHC-type containing protein [Tanacetum coccineum]
MINLLLFCTKAEHSGKGRRFKRRGNSNKNKGEWDLSKVRCFKCQKLGHLRKDCRGTSTTQEQSNLILEDDEPSLLMTTHEEVLLNEGQIQPEKYASGDASIWYLDNGASNHMTGVKSHFRDIDESVTGRITTPHLKKLDDKSIPLVYLGVEEGSKACRLYDPIAKKKHVSRDVKFMETKPWDWNKDEEDTSTQDTFWASFVVEGVDNESATPVNIDINDNIDDTYQEDDLINDPELANHTSQHTHTTHTQKEKKGILLRVEIGNLLLIEEEPRNYKEASIDKKWIEAMEIELDSINKNNTWTFKTFAPDQKAIGLKWVYKRTKGMQKEKIIKYKARLVAKGYVQEQGIDFDEVFAPVARIETVRLILALAAYHGWQVHHLDVKSAFLHGDLKEEVYVTQPEGFIQQGNSGKVYKLIKALYGLRQAPRAWNMKLDQTLKLLDFKKCNLEQAVYTRRSKTSTLIEWSINLSYSSLMLSRIMQDPEGTSPEGVLRDNSYGIQHDQGKGTTGIVFYFGESPIRGCTQKQPTVALSSCESEFMAATGAACQALWLKRLLSELTGWEEERITLKVDNISAIALVKNPVFHGRSKHIDIRYHFTRECVENGHINVEHVSGELQRADILTKALPRLKFVTMRQMLGVQDLGRSNDQD